jgi:threonine/homoserine/homoserine lactone efflux protein
MSALVNFALSFFFSFTGSIPPGTINLTAVQLGLDGRPRIAWRLALAAALAEYFYAFLAVKFADLITTSPLIVKNFHLIGATVMLTLGILNLRSATSPTNWTVKLQNSGFRRGLALGLLNPLALPFWIGVSAYLKSQHWIDLSDPWRLHAFLLGVSAGVYTLLVAVAYLAQKVILIFKHKTFINKIPGFVMLGLGAYGLVLYGLSLLRPAS